MVNPPRAFVCASLTLFNPLLARHRMVRAIHLSTEGEVCGGGGREWIRGCLNTPPHPTVTYFPHVPRMGEGGIGGGCSHPKNTPPTNHTREMDDAEYRPALSRAQIAEYQADADARPGQVFTTSFTLYAIGNKDGDPTIPRGWYPRDDDAAEVTAGNIEQRLELRPALTQGMIDELQARAVAKPHAVVVDALEMTAYFVHDKEPMVPMRPIIPRAASDPSQDSTDD